MDKTSAERRLRAATIRLAYEKPELRPYLIPLLKEADGPSMEELMGGRTWDGDTSTPEDSVPYNSHPNSPPAGPQEKGKPTSPQRKEYNRWFRKNVCPNHKTNCGMGEKR